MLFIKFLFIKLKRNSISSALIKYFLYGVLRVLFGTYRLKVIYANNNFNLLKNTKGIFYFWHQQIIGGMFFFFKTKSTGTCIVSPSNDGKIAGFLCRKLGFDVLYGSSHKSSIKVLRKALTTLQGCGRLCLVGDGSRGPAFQLQPGVSYLATKATVPLVFVECSASHALTFSKSWDQFKIPLPFSTISIVVHEPVIITPKCLQQGLRHITTPS